MVLTGIAEHKKDTFSWYYPQSIVAPQRTKSVPEFLTFYKIRKITATKPLIFLKNEGLTPVISGREQSGNSTHIAAIRWNFNRLRFFIA